MSAEKIKKVRPNIQVGGSRAFIQESEKGQKFRFIGFEEGKCHRRIIISSKMDNVYDPETDQDVQVAAPGYAILHMMEDMTGTPVINPGYREEGLLIEPDYTDVVYNKFISDILTFDTESNQPTGTIDMSNVYANFIRYVEKFAMNFDPSKNPDRKNIMVLTGVTFNPTPEQLANPEFNLDKATILNFKERWDTQLGVGSYKDIFEMTFKESVKEWMLKETSFKIPYTPTASANFTGVPFYGALPDATTEEGKHQAKVINSVASVARVLSQRNFETTSDKAKGLARDTEAYYKMYNDWVNEPKSNRQLVQRPNLNGIIFVLDATCNESCNQITADKQGKFDLKPHIHGVSPNKLAKMDKTKAYDSVMQNPDFIDIVFKYTTGESKAQMGQQMSCVKWEGSADTRVPFKEIKKLIDQTNSPSMPDRINTYTAFPFDQFVDSFRKYLAKLNENDGLAWLKEDETLYNQCKVGFEAVGFDIDKVEVSIEDMLKNSGVKGPGASAALGLGIAIAAPTPAPQPEVPQPVQTTPQPEVPQPVQYTPQPEVPQPVQTTPQPSIQA